MIRQRIIPLLAALLLIFSTPAAVWADTQDPSGSSDPSASSDNSGQTPSSDSGTDPSQNQQTNAPDPNSGGSSTNTSNPTKTCDFSNIRGIIAPTGAAAHTFKLNQTTCLYENDYYTWDPVTKEYTPKYDTTPHYNPADGKWETTVWVWDTPKDQYDPQVIVVNPTVNQNSPMANSINNGNGSGSNNNANNSNLLNIIINSDNSISVRNAIAQLAVTGDVSALQNTLVGSVMSGNAIDITNILNLLQASWNLQGAGDLMTFVANINGDVNGDLLLDPSQIANGNGTGSVSVNNTTEQTNLQVNSTTDQSITNDVNLNADSGNVAANQNTTVNNVASGNADVIANLVNVLDSAIAAGQSFIGVININGNLNGDILLPPDFLDQLIASGAPNATVNLSNLNTTNITANTTGNQSITNNVDLSANSGNATANDNTSVGSIGSGSAQTNLTIFNLTGRQIVGSNSLLVFINVLGSWVGVIMDAPAGSTTAALCGGNCDQTSVNDTNAALNETTNQSITNNVHGAAQTGDAQANANTDVGSVKTGSASASANILNIENSRLSLSNWFGILFINVLGNWHGSFGINTAAGNPVVPNGTNSPANNASGQVFKFVAASGGNPNIQQLVNQVEQNNGSGGQNNQPGAAGSTNKPNIPGAAGRSSSMATPFIVSASVFAIIFAGGAAIEYGDRLRVWSFNRKFNTGQAKAWMRFTLF